MRTLFVFKNTFYIKKVSHLQNIAISFYWINLLVENPKKKQIFLFSVLEIFLCFATETSSLL